jgi:hypothetical protein
MGDQAEVAARFDEVSKACHDNLRAKQAGAASRIDHGPLSGGTFRA